MRKTVYGLLILSAVCLYQWNERRLQEAESARHVAEYERYSLTCEAPGGERPLSCFYGLLPEDCSTDQECRRAID